MQEEHSIRPSLRNVLLAFAAVYIIWGSTYLGIRYAIETLPPFLMSGSRFLLAGALMYGWLRWRGAASPARGHWLTSAVVGLLMLGFGNGLVTWAEQEITSSHAALIIAITPLWFALIDWLRPGGTKPSKPTMVGIVLGFCGVVVLVSSKSQPGESPVSLVGSAAVVFASFSWALGSLYSRYAKLSLAPLMAVALQMLAGGVILTVTGVVVGEPAHLDFSQISSRSAWAFFYLVVFGSLVAFSAYAWLLKVTTPARLSTYAYVNPVIAVILGWSLGGETITSKSLLAAVIIVVGVLIITLQKSRGVSQASGGSKSS